MSAETSFPKILDKHGQPIGWGETVRFFAQKSPEAPGQKGWARLDSWADDTLSVLVWIEAWSSYQSSPTVWPTKWSEEKQAYLADVVSEEGQTTWLEREPEAYSFDQPAEKWPDALSIVAMEFIREEGVTFCLRNSELPPIQVADPNGLLGALLYQGEKRLKQVFGEEASLPIVYFAHPRSMVGMSFDFDPEFKSPRNTLFYHSHLLLDTLTRMVDEARATPEATIDGMIQLDIVVQEWFTAARDLKFKVMPYRPITTTQPESSGGPRPAMASAR